MALFFLPTLCLGAVTPLAIRLRIPSTEKAGTAAGTVFGISTMGSIFGTLFTAFFLIERYGVRSIIIKWGLVLAIMAAVAAFGKKKTARVVAMALLCVTAAGYATAESGVLLTRDTLYHHIIVEDRGDSRLLRFDASQQSRMSISKPLTGHFEYIDMFHAAFAFNPDIKSVLFVGLGGGSAPRMFRHYYPLVQIDIVEIDPVVVEIARDYFHFKEDMKMSVKVQDARVFLTRSTKKYDLIVLDAYASSDYGTNVPFHLVTKEFFALASQKMSKNGVLMYNVIGRTSWLGSRPVRATFKTMQTAFPGVCTFPAASSPNVVLCGVRTPQAALPQTLLPQGRNLVNSGRVKLPNFLTRLEQYSKVVLDTQDVPLLTDDFAPIDNLLR
jgi:spermidine synthase